VVFVVKQTYIEHSPSRQTTADASNKWSLVDVQPHSNNLNIYNNNHKRPLRLYINPGFIYKKVLIPTHVYSAMCI